MAGRMSFHCHRTTLGFPGTNAIVLLIICILTGVGSNEVIVDPRVTAVLGKNITLMCTVEVGRNLSLTQTSWERKHNGSTLTLAVFNPIYGISIAEDYKKRLFFKDPSNEDATIVLEDVGFADTGVYTCKVATFPLGNTQASTMVTVMVEPKVYVSAGSAPLIDGGNETVVATCTAERGKPRAEVSWESDLFGRPVVKYIDEANGTSTMEVQYRWKPTRLVQGRKLTCVVRHPALETEFRIPYVLNVQYAPVIQIKGYDNNWFAGRENVQLVCQADANPPPARYIWTRLDKDLPPGVQIVNGTLSFNRALDRNDSGIYQCDVANDIGHQHKQMDISIQEPPPTTTTPPTTPPPLPTAAATILVATKRVQFTSPTLESLPEGNLGTIIGGAVGGALFLILLIVLVGVCYMRKRRTFRGDYYTKQYIGPSDMQKESQLDVLQPHELEMYNEPSKGDIKPKSNDGIYPEFSKEMKNDEWGHVDNMNNRCTERDAVPVSYYGDSRGPSGNTYLPDDYYEGNDSDYVSHLDGSVISRREWYV
ncbi:nectin-3-like protein isoform X1 [Lepisosteus oculatus]|uniref:nectin-3-like protein isoform X1 n=2 Tax=Lepisosteus oculatus TaxID=7918 RepID=UPI003718A3A4